ncbi:MAG: GNAT family N-acetyltransferase [Ardenticatenaceae bacterium]|nr:GNAT family N-acetyltransferase [Ardenticatenaceae bacterium]
MIDIRPLTTLTLPDFQRIASGYRADKQYAVTYTTTAGGVAFTLEPVWLAQPFIKEWTHEADTIARYAAILAAGYSFGAYAGVMLVGIVVAEAHEWNHSLWVWEFHVATDYRHHGIGRRLMASVVEKAREAKFRVIVCETQNTNGTGIDIYRQLGFQVEGVDISYYTNQDYPDGEVAVFMKRRLD